MLGQLKPRQIVRQFPESHKMWPRNRFRQLKENALAQQVVTGRWLLTSPRQTISESADCACLGFHPRSCSSVKRACKPDRSQLFCWKSPTHIASLSHRSRFFRGAYTSNAFTAGYSALPAIPDPSWSPDFGADTCPHVIDFPCYRKARKHVIDENHV